MELLFDFWLTVTQSLGEGKQVCGVLVVEFLERAKSSASKFAQSC